MKAATALPASTVAARKWLAALLERRDSDAWAGIDPEFRREAAGLWVAAHREFLGETRGDIIERLAAATADEHAPFGTFACLWLELVRAGFAARDTTGWGWSTRSRPAGEGYEVALFARPLAVLYGPGGFTPGVGFVMRRDGDGWRVAAFEGLFPEAETTAAAAP